MILQVFFDESGYELPGPGEAFIFAGFFGPVRAWETFAHGWEPILKKPQALSAKGLKHSLRRHPNSKRINELVRVIKDCKQLYRVSVTIPSQAYENAITSELAQLRGRGLTDEVIRLVDNEYYFGFNVMVLQILLPMVWQLGDKAELEVIYDENLQEADKLKTAYHDFVENNPEGKQLRREPRAESDEKFMQLQAADLLAWHIHRDYVERQQGRVHEGRVWSALNEIPESPPIVLNESDLRKIADFEKILAFQNESTNQ